MQIDVEPLAVIAVEHPFGHVHLDAAQGIGHRPDRRQIHHHVVGDRSSQFAGEFSLEQICSPEAVEGIDLVGAIPLRFDIGIPGHLGDPGNAAIDAQAGDHIGVPAPHIRAEQQDVLVGDAAPGRKRIGDGGVPARARIGEQLGERRGQQQAPAQPNSDRQKQRSAPTPSAGSMVLGGSHPPKAISRSGPYGPRGSPLRRPACTRQRLA